MCVNVVRASIAMGNFTHVANYVTKAESTPDSASDAALASQLRLASGLSSLEGKKYKQAARKFLEVSADHAPSYAEIASVQDVALYGGLCALASFDRAELRTKLIDAAGFRAFLELCPQVREAYALEDMPCMQVLTTAPAPHRCARHCTTSSTAGTPRAWRCSTS